jgi:uncharacterized protein YkwD
VFQSSVFSDVPQEYAYADAVEYLHAFGIMQGFTDGRFHPERRASRAELVKMLVSFFMSPETVQKCVSSGMPRVFVDVSLGEWYDRFITAAVCRRFLASPADTAFRPLQPVTLSEAADLFQAFFRLPSSPSMPKDNMALRLLAERSAIPLSVRKFDSPLTRGEVAEILYRLAMNITDRPSFTYEELKLVTAGKLYAAADAPSTSEAEMLFHLINIERSKAKLSLLRYSRHLDEAALIHAQDMERREYYSHTTPEGKGPEERIRDTGYFSCSDCALGWKYRWGENIGAEGSATDIIKSWLGSPGHKQILLSPSFTEVGIGVSGDRWVADFGGIKPQ